MFGIMESHDLDSGIPLLLSLQAQGKLGLVNDVRNGTCRILEDGREEVKRSSLWDSRLVRRRRRDHGAEQVAGASYIEDSPICGNPTSRDDPSGEALPSLAGEAVALPRVVGKQRLREVSCSIASVGLVNGVLNTRQQDFASVAKGSMCFDRHCLRNTPRLPTARSSCLSIARTSTAPAARSTPEPSPQC